MEVRLSGQVCGGGFGPGGALRGLVGLLLVAAFRLALLHRQASFDELLHGRHALSFPSWAPLFPMDRIYCRGLRPLRAERLGGAAWRALSDHMPLMAWFTP